VTATSPNRKDPITLEFDNAWDDARGHYPITPKGHWNIAIGGEGRDCTALWSLSKRVSLVAGTTLTFEMQFGAYDGAENLGRFRLSATSDRASFASTDKAVERSGPPIKGPGLIGPTRFQLPSDAEGKAFTNSIGMKLVRIPAGTFTMGSPEGEAGRATEEKQHRVTISQFCMGIHEVTQKQFKEVMGYNPSFSSLHGEGKPGVVYGVWKPGGGKEKVAGLDTSDFPVENVSWHEAVEFCERLSAREAEKRAGRKYRLPTEAEWEYCCRGGASSYQTFHFGNSLSSRQANFGGPHAYDNGPKGDYLQRPCPVGSYAPNAWGLYDMHANVIEWCSDWYAADYYGKSPAEDPPGPPGGSHRVIRGGSYGTAGSDTRSARRYPWVPWSGTRHLGFRVAAVLSGE
jgi:formylglycine-generating enzyme required for sulfatase activity